MKKYKIILASNSPRRKELLAGLDIDFEVKVIDGIDESYPDGLPSEEVPQYIAQRKAAAYESLLDDDTLVITADTVVVVGDEILGKPRDDEEARQMLRRLSGRTHQVTTGVCMRTKSQERVFAVTTDVTFKAFSDEEINYYVDTYHPLDKAGAYGIQEWIGHIGVVALRGSYFNVMWLPVLRIYEGLLQLSQE